MGVCRSIYHSIPPSIILMASMSSTYFGQCKGDRIPRCNQHHYHGEGWHSLAYDFCSLCPAIGIHAHVQIPNGPVGFRGGII